MSIEPQHLSSSTQAPTVAQLEARIERLESSLLQLQEVMEQVPALVAVATDMVDEALANSGMDGAEIEARAKGTARLAAALTEPDTLASLERILNRLSIIEESLEMAAALPGLVATAVDIVDEALAKAQSHGIELSKLNRKLRDVGFEGAHLLQEIDLSELRRAGVFGSAQLRIVGAMGQALAEAGREASPVGLWGAMRASREEDMQRSLGFGVRFARRLGQLLRPGLTSPSSSST